MRIRFAVALMFVVAMFAATAGCSTEPAATQQADDAKSAADEEARFAAALDKLSPEDRALAVAQRNCPVSGHRLGSMDAPIIVEVEGRKVFLCCESCREPMLDRPAEFMAKLPPVGEAEK